MEGDRRRFDDPELYAAIGESRAGIKYLVKNFDELKAAMAEITKKAAIQCLDCPPAIGLAKHLKETEDQAIHKWERKVLWTTVILSVCGNLWAWFIRKPPV